MEVSTQPTARSSESRDSRPRKALTIGAVCKVLGQEFDDISISKIRYLEDQKLLTPRRTRGGYRLYSQADVEQLRAILRMQRDEFLPLRVIRQELAAGKIGGDRGGARAASSRKAMTLDEPDEWVSHDDVIEQTGAAPELIRELEEFGIVQPRQLNGTKLFDETDVEIVRAATELAQIRRRRPQPARLPDLRRSRVLAARAGDGTVAALPERRPPRGGDREPREPRRHLHPAQAPAAGSRPEAPPRLADADVARSRVIGASADRVWGLVADPHNLPRWWPETSRVEDVEGDPGSRRSSFTQVLKTSKGRIVRADFRCTASTARPADRLEPAARGHPLRGVSPRGRAGASPRLGGRSRRRRVDERHRRGAAAAARDVEARLADDAAGDRAGR